MKLWIVEYRIDRKWQTDGEWFTTLRAAKGQAEANLCQFRWAYRITPASLLRYRPRTLRRAGRAR